MVFDHEPRELTGIRRAKNSAIRFQISVASGNDRWQGDDFVMLQQRRSSMLAAVRLRAGWLTVGTALGLAGCSASPISLPEISLAMPALPGFGQREVTPAMEPVPIAPAAASVIPVKATSAPMSGANERPAFFVQWEADGMKGMTRRPRVDASTPLPKYPAGAMRDGETGTTTLESCVTVDGRLADVKLARSSGSVALDSATLAWAQTAKFVPAQFNGEVMAVCGWRLDYQWRVTEGR
jgi:TonB family protein